MQITSETRVRANTPGLPAEQWGELRDLLVLAVDALGDAPGQVTQQSLVECISYQRSALKLTHRRVFG